MKCGLECDDEYSFCYKCGSELTSVATIDKFSNLSVVEDDLCDMGLDFLNNEYLYDKAFAVFRYLALRDNRKAQFYYGYMFETAKEVEHDHEKAIEWYARSAEGNCYLAMLRLGSLYMFGNGVKRNINEAYKLYSMVLDSDFCKREVTLGKELTLFDDFALNESDKEAYFNCGVEKRYIELFYEETDAKNIIDLPSLCLGKMYERGIGVPKNLDKAFYFFNAVATAYDNMDAQYSLGNIYSNNDFSRKDLSKAKEWYLKAVMNGHYLASQKLETLDLGYKNSMKTPLKKDTFDSLFDDNDLINGVANGDIGGSKVC